VNHMLLIIGAVVTLSAIVFWLVRRRDDNALGSMSERWLAENRASRR